MNLSAAALAATLLLAPTSASSAEVSAPSPSSDEATAESSSVAAPEQAATEAQQPAAAPEAAPLEPTAGAATAVEETTPEASEPAVLELEQAADDWVKLNLSLSYELKNFSLGFSFRYLDYLQTDVATDFLLTALLMGLGLDDLNAFRITLSETAAVRIYTDAWAIEPRFGARPQPGPIPVVVVGAGIWGLAELDSLAQLMRLGDAGVFLSASAGFFVAFVFSAIDVSLAYRPLSTTGYYLDNEWDSTLLQFGNPVLELGLTYTLPW